MKLDLATATLILAAISQVAASPVAAPVTNTQLTVRELDQINNAIASLNHFNSKRDTMDFAEIARRENQIVTDVLTAITQTNLAPGIINYIIDDPDLSAIAEQVIILTIQTGVISLQTLLTSLNDSGLAVDVVQSLIQNCNFYKQIYKIVLQQLANLPTLIGNILKKSPGEIISDIAKIAKREEEEQAVKLYTRDEQDIITSLMESLKNSGLANQVVNALVVNDNFYTFGASLVEKLIDKGLISISNIVSALIKSGLIPSMIEAFLNIDTMKTVIVNALAAAFGNCSEDTSPTTSFVVSPTATASTLELPTATPTTPKVCKRRRRRRTGQCGNQVGLQYWNQLAVEHGINPDGTAIPIPEDTSLRFSPLAGTTDTTSTTSNKSRDDKPELFFSCESSQQRYTPRSILIDLEPSVINKCTAQMPMINPRNVHLSEDGSGAANNWQSGYIYGTNYETELLSLIDRELDKCDNLSSFQLIHGVAGGTGAGVGSKILELLHDGYGSKKLLTTFSIFPYNEGTSDVVVQPYNTILTLKRLIEFTDATFVFHNDAMNSIENLLYPKKNNNRNGFDRNGSNAFNETNKLIALISASISNPLRFPGYMFGSYDSIYSTLIPSPDLKFLTSSIGPKGSTNAYDLILELSNDRYKTNRSSSNTNYISMINYIIGDDLNEQEIKKSILKLQKRTNFIPWVPRSIPVVHGKKSRFTEGKLSGIQVSNNTSIIDMFTKILKQYDMLANRKAYITGYTQDNSQEERERVMDMFRESREVVARVIDEYDRCKSKDYLEDEMMDIDEL
ncbi:Tubulin gamma chain [Spathaspora sp. JA1]|nr:Tubulin gamma chain [Spathaspora sp. JA1]